MSNDRSVVEKTCESLWKFFYTQPVEDKTLLSFQQAWSKPIHQLIEQVLSGTLNHYFELDHRFEYSSASEKEIIVWWRYNIEKKNVLSTNEKLFLGIFYFHQKNYRQAKIYFQQITQESGAALYYLGIMYAEGLDFIPNTQRAKDYFKQAEKYALSDALIGLSAIARCSHQTDEMLKLYRIAAQKNNSEAQALLGIIYDKGEYNIPKNIKIALEFHHRAAANGNLLALYYLGQIYSRSWNNYAEITNTKRAVSYYQIVASKGLAEAIYDLGCCYSRGRGIKKNKKMAIDLLNQAVEKGIYFGLNELGFLSECEKQYQAAAKFYFDGIEKGVYEITIRMIRLFDEYKYQSSKDAFIIIYYAGKTYALLHTSDKMKKIVDERKSTPEDKYKYDRFLSEVPYIFNQWAKEKPKELATLLRDQDPSLNLELLLQPDVAKTIRDENSGYLKKQEAEIKKALSSILFIVPVINLIANYLDQEQKTKNNEISDLTNEKIALEKEKNSLKIQIAKKTKEIMEHKQARLKVQQLITENVEESRTEIEKLKQVIATLRKEKEEKTPTTKNKKTTTSTEKIEVACNINSFVNKMSKEGQSQTAPPVLSSNSSNSLISTATRSTTSIT